MLKTAVLKIATFPIVRGVFRPLLGNQAIIFMLHRFKHPERGVPGHDPGQVRRALAWLRRHKREVLGLETLVGRLNGEGPPLRGAVAFTIDDGYFDHAEVGARVFAEFDYPVTTFLTSGFVDRLDWFWWDKIEYIFRTSSRPRVVMDVDGMTEAFELGDAGARAAAQARFTEECKRVPDDGKHHAISRLAELAEVVLPESAPPAYAAMSWDDARRCERSGMTFGPHTVTHPILSRTPDAQSEFELSQSWQRIQEELEKPTPVFCYPNGQAEDFGEREIRCLQDLGLAGAVVGWPGYVAAASRRGDPDASFRIRRFGWPEDLPHFIQYVSGLERLKELLRPPA